jgi:hypothetical protein
MPKPLYHWDAVFRKGKWHWRRGRDYHCGTSSIAQQIRNAASRRGHRVHLTETENGITVAVGNGVAPKCRK